MNSKPLIQAYQNLVTLRALQFMHCTAWNWKTLNEYGYVQRAPLAAKLAGIVAHDRAVNGEQSRGLPSHYGDNGRCG